MRSSIAIAGAGRVGRCASSQRAVCIGSAFSSARAIRSGVGTGVAGAKAITSVTAIIAIITASAPNMPSGMMIAPNSPAAIRIVRLAATIASARAFAPPRPRRGLRWSGIKPSVVRPATRSAVARAAMIA